MGEARTERREDPRVTRSKAQVLAAAVDLLAHDGATGFTIEKVAVRSGVARTTIYRHWPERGELIFDAIGSLGEALPIAHTDDLLADLRANLRDLAAALARSTWAALLPTVIDAAARDETFAGLARAFSNARRAPLRGRLDAAVADGTLRPDVDTDLLAAQLVGPLFYRRLVSHQPITGAVVDQVLSAVTAQMLGGSSRAAFS